MEEINTGKIPLFKKIDKALFEKINQFKLTPSYNSLQDFYNALEEDQQRLLKAIVILILFLLPVMFVGFAWWQNNSLQDDLNIRISIIKKANEIIGQKQSLRDISPEILSESPIDGESMMTSRLSNLLSSASIDLSKIKTSGYEGSMISNSIMRSESDFSFNNLSTDELMNLFTAMIQREKFRIESVNITRNAENNLLQGKFHAIHLSNIQGTEEEE